MDACPRLYLHARPLFALAPAPGLGASLFHRRGPARGTDPVVPAKRSEAALTKTSRRKDDDGEPLHSFATLVDELASLTRNTVVFAGGARITKLATPIPLQRRAFELIGAPVPIELKPMQTEHRPCVHKGPLLSGGPSRYRRRNFGLVVLVLATCVPGLCRRPAA